MKNSFFQTILLFLLILPSYIHAQNKQDLSALAGEARLSLEKGIAFIAVDCH
jgi:hypothetical protein